MKAEELEALASIAAGLDQLRLQAKKINAEFLAFLIGTAIDEAEYQGVWAGHGRGPIGATRPSTG